MNSFGLSNLNRDNIDRHVTLCLHKGRSVAQADIFLLEIEGKEYVLKDIINRPRLIKETFGKRLIEREWRVYKQLQGITGIPKIYKKIDPSAFVMEYIPGMRISRRRHSGMEPEFFVKLKNIVREMHERGVTHGDIRRKNIMITPDNEPYIIDFAGAFRVKERFSPEARKNAPFFKRPLYAVLYYFQKMFFKRLVKVDNVTILKMHHYLNPDSLSEKERHKLENIPWYLKVGRFLKKKVYRKIKHATWKRGGR